MLRLGRIWPTRPGRVPGGAAGQLALLEQQHVGDAELGQVVGGRAAGDAAADDDHTRMARQRHRTPAVHRIATAAATPTEHPWNTTLRHLHVRAIRPDRAVDTLQRLPYFIGVSGHTVGATGMSDAPGGHSRRVRAPSRTSTSAMRPGST